MRADCFRCVYSPSVIGITTCVCVCSASIWIALDWSGAFVLWCNCTVGAADLQSCICPSPHCVDACDLSSLWGKKSSIRMMMAPWGHSQYPVIVLCLAVFSLRLLRVRLRRMWSWRTTGWISARSDSVEHIVFQRTRPAVQVFLPCRGHLECPILDLCQTHLRRVSLCYCKFIVVPFQGAFDTMNQRTWAQRGWCYRQFIYFLWQLQFLQNSRAPKLVAVKCPPTRRSHNSRRVRT